ncbi:MAG: glycosyl hydrolase family 28 protein [Victivallales bacterium]
MSARQMTYFLFAFLSPLFGSLPAKCGPEPAASAIINYPSPDKETLSSDYTITSCGEDVPVYALLKADSPKPFYSFAYFDYDGKTDIIVKIRSSKPLGNLKVYPKNLNLNYKINGYTVEFAISKACKFTVEPDGRNAPLHVFINPFEKETVDKNDRKVKYFGPGIHRPEGGRIVLNSDETLYVAGGAILKASISCVNSSNVRISGRGIIDGSDWPHGRGPSPHLMNVNGKDITIDGVIIRGSWSWTIVPRSCDRVTISNVKILCGRVHNDDGIDPVNSRDINITDCFIRTSDDGIAIKGYDRENGPCERISVTKCQLYMDGSRAFLIGHESAAAAMRDITYSDIDIIHYASWIFLIEPNNECVVENITAGDIRINGIVAPGDEEIPWVIPHKHKFCQIRPGGPFANIDKSEFKGRAANVRNVVFKNISMDLDAGRKVFIGLNGVDDKHLVGNVIFDNFTVNGKKITMDDLTIAKYYFMVDGKQIINNAEDVNYVRNVSVKY